MLVRKLTVVISSCFLASFQAVAIDNSNVDVNGFASIAYSDSSNNSGYANVDDGNIVPGSLVGLQALFEIDDNFESLIQATARTKEDWDVDLTLAFLKYKSPNNLEIRGGRIRAPLFFLSEYEEVGYAHPWARSPISYDILPASSVNGGDVAYEYELDDSYVVLQAFLGSESFVEDGLKGELSDAYGINTTWYDDNLSLRLGYSVATVDFLGANIYDEEASFLSLGGRYDNDAWLVMAEYTQMRISDVHGTPLSPDNDTSYALVGYRIDSVMPYVLFSRIETQGVDTIRVIPGGNPGSATFGPALNYKTNTYSIGGRWDFKPGFALKGDITYVDFLGTSGGLGELGPTGFKGNDVDDDFIYTVKLDVAF
jgi:hypothetical protein